MKNLLSLFLLALLSAAASGQNPEIKRTWHWYFGDGAGLDFSSGIAVADTNGQVYAQEASAAISDTAGNLLFYTDGQTVWDSTHNIMPNGTGIGGCAVNSSSQGALIIPQPGNDSLFYIFTTDCAQNNFANGLRYSIVNMNLNGGQGAVTTKNNYLFDSVEKLCATHHSNGTDVWVVAHQLNTNNYYAYLLTSTGINPVPVISGIGSVDDGVNTMGYMKFSPDGKRVANNNVFSATPYSLELCSFNSSTGVISNLIPLSTDLVYPYFTFSPDNSLLYALHLLSGTINQFDICSVDSALILATELQIATPSSGGDIRIGPDYKLYLDKGTQNIGVIYNPNIYGVGANYQGFDISLNGRYANEALPNFVESYFFKDTLPCPPIAINEQDYVEQEIALVYPIPASDYINIELLESSPKTTLLGITDMLGSAILQKELFNELTLDVSGYPQGVYLITIRQNQKLQLKKITITH